MIKIVGAPGSSGALKTSPYIYLRGIPYPVTTLSDVGFRSNYGAHYPVYSVEVGCECLGENPQHSDGSNLHYRSQQSPYPTTETLTR